MPRRVEVPGLEEQRVALFQAAFDRYMASGKWPLLDDLARDLVEEFDVDEVVQGLGWPWVDASHLNSNNRVGLRLPAIARCQGAEPLLDAFLVALRFAVHKYFDKSVRPVVTQASLVAEAGLSNALAHHAMLLLTSEHVPKGWQGSVPGDMMLEFNGRVRKFQVVRSIEHYFELSGQEVPSLGTREKHFVPGDESEVAGPAQVVPGTAFVMMWLAPDNPDREGVAQAIRASFAAYGIEAVHAMDIDHDGPITDLILSRIREAEFLVADLTGERPSVYYEVGYAHALGKRTMLVRKRDTRIHFDLSVHNAPEYEDAAALRAMLARRLLERIGPVPSANP